LQAKRVNKKKRKEAKKGKRSEKGPKKRREGKRSEKRGNQQLKNSAKLSEKVFFKVRMQFMQKGCKNLLYLFCLFSL
jgi:hypothetical protein